MCNGEECNTGRSVCLLKLCLFILLLIIIIWSDHTLFVRLPVLVTFLSILDGEPIQMLMGSKSIDQIDYSVCDCYLQIHKGASRRASKLLIATALQTFQHTPFIARSLFVVLKHMLKSGYITHTINET